MIEAVGPGCPDFRVGERVAYACPPVGAYCERRNMSPELLVHLPDDISDEIAAAGLLKGVTASFLLHDVHAVQTRQRRADPCRRRAASARCWCNGRAISARPSSPPSRRDDKARIVERLGAHHVVVYSRENFADAVMQITGGRGADVVYDAVGNDTFARFAGGAWRARPSRQLRPGVRAGRQLGHRPLRVEIDHRLAPELWALHRHARQAGAACGTASSRPCASARCRIEAPTRYALARRGRCASRPRDPPQHRVHRAQRLTCGVPGPKGDSLRASFDLRNADPILWMVMRAKRMPLPLAGAWRKGRGNPPKRRAQALACRNELSKRSAYCNQ